MTAPQTVKPEHLDRHLVAGCSIGHKPPSMLADGTCANLKAQRTYQKHFPQR